MSKLEIRAVLSGKFSPTQEWEVFDTAVEIGQEQVEMFIGFVRWNRPIQKLSFLPAEELYEFETELIVELAKSMKMLEKERVRLER